VAVPKSLISPHLTSEVASSAAHFSFTVDIDFIENVSSKTIQLEKPWGQAVGDKNLRLLKLSQPVRDSAYNPAE